MVQKEKMSKAYDYLPSFHTLPKIKNNCVLPYLTFGEEEFCDMAYYRKKHEVVEQKNRACSCICTIKYTQLQNAFVLVDFSLKNS